jgi:hypothetical protein
MQSVETQKRREFSRALMRIEMLAVVTMETVPPGNKMTRIHLAQFPSEEIAFNS